MYLSLAVWDFSLSVIQNVCPCSIRMNVKSSIFELQITPNRPLSRQIHPKPSAWGIPFYPLSDLWQQSYCSEPIGIGAAYDPGCIASSESRKQKTSIWSRVSRKWSKKCTRNKAEPDRQSIRLNLQSCCILQRPVSLKYFANSCIMKLFCQTISSLQGKFRWYILRVFDYLNCKIIIFC